MAAACEAVVAESADAQLCAYGHLGDGNLHFNLLPPTDQSLADFKKQPGPEISRRIHELAHGLGGSVCAEHGVGQLKAGLLAQYSSPVAIKLMRDIKGALDPAGLMNPGKVLLPE